MSEIAPVITIDGPSGSGKGTISQRLAQHLGWHLLDSGMLYRVLALAAQQHAVALDNEAALEILAGHLDVQFQVAHRGEFPAVRLEGIEVTDRIREEACGNAASQIAALPAVRLALLERQRAFRHAPGLVTDGRDMGTVVFPDAPLKIFLAASPEERANRRYRQLMERGINANIDAILEALIERDLRDKSRATAPLKPADDALLIDTTGYTVHQVFMQIMQAVKHCFNLT